MEVIGKVKLIKPTETVGNNGFQKRDIIITTDEQYPQHLSIQFVQDKCSLLDAYQVGQDVKISINLRGREWINPEGQAIYFNTIQGWRIENLMPQQAQGGATPPPPAFAPAPDVTEPEADDLPF